MEDELAEEMLKGNLNPGSKVNGDFDTEKNKIVYKFTKGQPQVDEKDLDKPQINSEGEKDKSGEDVEELENSAKKN